MEPTEAQRLRQPQLRQSPEYFRAPVTTAPNRPCLRSELDPRQPNFRTEHIAAGQKDCRDQNVDRLVLRNIPWKLASTIRIAFPSYRGQSCKCRSLPTSNSSDCQSPRSAK